MGSLVKVVLTMGWEDRSDGGGAPVPTSVLDRKPSRTLLDTLMTRAPFQPLARDFSTERSGPRHRIRSKSTLSRNGDHTGKSYKSGVPLRK